MRDMRKEIKLRMDGRLRNTMGDLLLNIKNPIPTKIT